MIRPILLCFLLCGLLVACTEPGQALGPRQIDLGGRDSRSADAGSEDGGVEDIGREVPTARCGMGTLEGYRRDTCGDEADVTGCDVSMMFVPGDTQLRLPCEGLELVVRDRDGREIQRNFGHLNSRGSRWLRWFLLGPGMPLDEEGQPVDSLAGRVILWRNDEPIVLVDVVGKADSIRLQGIDSLVGFLDEARRTLAACRNDPKVLEVDADHCAPLQP